MAVLGASDYRSELRAGPLDRLRMLQSIVLHLMGTASYHPAGRRHIELEQLIEFVFQATENTFDHARKTLDGDLIRQVRYLSIERHIVGTGAGGVPVAEMAPDPESALHVYLNKLQARAVLQGGDPERLRLVHVTIADGGIGIAAKMADSLDIYGDDVYSEFKVVQEAVLPEGTTKPPGEPGRGVGMRKMMRATHVLDGSLEIRTGRLALQRDYLNNDGSTTDAKFVSRDSSSFELRGATDQVAMVAGTSISLLIPEFDMNTSRRQRGAPETVPS